jgi:hypothetical protein
MEPKEKRPKYLRVKDSTGTEYLCPTKRLA